jgi:hypothetical protein
MWSTMISMWRARAFEGFLRRFLEVLPPPSTTLRRVVIEHLGEDPSELPRFMSEFASSNLADAE